MTRYAVLLILLAATGCSFGGPTPVRGVVKLDGKPLARAAIVFLAQDAGGRDANGTSDADGVFRLTTLQPNDGALPGNYKVVVQPPAATNTGGVTATPEDAQRAAGEGRANPTGPGATIAPRFSLPDKTTLTQTIPATGPIILELTSK